MENEASDASTATGMDKSSDIKTASLVNSSLNNTIRPVSSNTLKSSTNELDSKDLNAVQKVSKSMGNIYTKTTLATPINANTSVNKRTATDFIFGKVIGEGSFSTVYLAKDIHTNKEYAIKVCEKHHILKEKKVEYVKREKEVLNLLCDSKNFFVKLFCTFQDNDRLYFVLTYAKNGELLPYINKVGSFDIECTKFYSAEILRGLEYLHGLNIIHRDLKPENILLDEKMHILITDFGSAKIIECESESKKTHTDNTAKMIGPIRRDSFVGTAQYVSPELLTNKSTTQASDLWAFGCIIYQMVAGLPPFRSRSEYLIFQKILNLQFEIPDGFDSLAHDLISRLLVINPSERLGASDKMYQGYSSIRAHSFFSNIDFETLHIQVPPAIYPYLPGTSEHEELRSHYRITDTVKPGLDDKQMTRLLGLELTEQAECSDTELSEKPFSKERKEYQKVCKLDYRQKNKNIANLTSSEEFKQKLEEQKASNEWNHFVEGNLIVKQGFINKRKGLFARKRMLLLTTGPHLYYIDPVSMQLKGEIPWSKDLRVEPKNFKIFFVHTPNRTYYLDDPQGFALDWCQAIEDVRMHYYDDKKRST